MSNKQLLSSTIPIIQDNVVDVAAEKLKAKRPGALEKFILWLKGGEKDNTAVKDSAVEIIAQIENEEIAGIVRDLHYRTPRSLQAMRNVCEECFVLPEDCPHYDYSIFDVKKAIKRLTSYPSSTHDEVIEELQKINQELAYHLHEHFEEV